MLEMPITMGFGSSRSTRVQDDTAFLPSIMMTSSNVPAKQTYSSKTAKAISMVFSEDYGRGAKKMILDPRGDVIRRWNNIFLVACIVSLFVDPLFFYLQSMSKGQCIDIGFPLELTLTIVRSVADAFYFIHIFIRFRTAYVAPSSRVFGRGELVIDPSKISLRYLETGFFLDLIAALPLPQLLIWIIIPSLNGSIVTNTKNVLMSIIILQYFPKLYLIYPLSSKIIEAHGVVTETAWAGAAYNLTFYMLASHVLGAGWYFLSVERLESCWRSLCDQDKTSCRYSLFDCNPADDSRRAAWFLSSNASALCSPASGYYKFGIYGDASTENIASSSFFRKYLYCLWWGLKNLSSLGQSLSTTTVIGEILFAIVIAILGLVLFALLIGNMQTYLQSTTLRLEEWRVKRNDIEGWMQHRLLPPELRESIRRYDQYKWMATRGVNEGSLLRGLPMDLRRDIKRHLGLDLVRKVPLFEQLDERVLDAICERLKPALCTKRTTVVREGDPVSEMLFIIRGHLDSFTTNGGRTGFFNSSRIGPGEFCGEELLTWVLEGPRPSAVFPSSTRTVKAITEVEAFALSADDLKFVAAQFRMLHSKKLRHKLRFYSHQWRTWAACIIQVAWRRHQRRQEIAELIGATTESSSSSSVRVDGGGYSVIGSSSSGNRTYKHLGSSLRVLSFVQKPAEPDFAGDDDDD